MTDKFKDFTEGQEMHFIFSILINWSNDIEWV